MKEAAIQVAKRFLEIGRYGPWEALTYGLWIGFLAGCLTVLTVEVVAANVWEVLR